MNARRVILIVVKAALVLAIFYVALRYGPSPP